MRMTVTDNVVVESGRLARLVMARLKPNVDLTEAVESLCASHGFKNAIVRGACGSLIDANVWYASKGAPIETCISGPGVELLNLFGEVREGKEATQVTNLHGVVADTQGRIYAGEVRSRQEPELHYGRANAPGMGSDRRRGVGLSARSAS